MGFSIANPRWVSAIQIDVDWDHPEHGPIQYTAVDGSGEVEMQAIWDAIMHGDFGPVAPLEISE